MSSCEHDAGSKPDEVIDSWFDWWRSQMNPDSVNALSAAQDTWQQSINLYLKNSQNACLDWCHYSLEQLNLETTDKRALSILAQQYFHAMSPDNFYATNADSVRTAVATHGASIQRGIFNLLGDLQKGCITQIDSEGFELGKNLAATEGKVIFRNALMELIAYTPTTQKLYQKPLLIVPPCINKYYILDLSVHNSLVKFLVDQGHQVFLISWRNIDEESAHFGWEDYISLGVLTAIKETLSFAEMKDLNTLGFCIGGTLLAAALEQLKTQQKECVSSATFLATMLDFSDTGDLGALLKSPFSPFHHAQITNTGVIYGQQLAALFSFLRPKDMIWHYVTENYLKGNPPGSWDILYWNSDGMNLSAAMLGEYLQGSYIKNQLFDPSSTVLKSIDIPIYVLATKEDHIVPWKTAYKSMHLFHPHADSVFTLGSSGHVAGIINPPTKKNRHYWLNASQCLDSDQWLEQAQQHPGSWWSHWAQWLSQRSGSTQSRSAKKVHQSLSQKGLYAAPGEYVCQNV